MTPICPLASTQAMPLDASAAPSPVSWLTLPWIHHLPKPIRRVPELPLLCAGWWLPVLEPTSQGDHAWPSSGLGSSLLLYPKLPSLQCTPKASPWAAGPRVSVVRPPLGWPDTCPQGSQMCLDRNSSTQFCTCSFAQNSTAHSPCVDVLT